VEIWEPQPPGTFRACPGIAVYSIKGHMNEELEKMQKEPVRAT
jgi:hypothetical protein